MKEYYVLDIYEFDYIYSYACDNLDVLLDFLNRYSHDNTSANISYYIYKTWYNKQKFETLGIDVLEYI